MSNELIAYRLNVTKDAVFDIKLFYSSETNRKVKCELDTGFFILTLEQVTVTGITRTNFFFRKSADKMNILLTRGQYLIIPVSFRFWRSDQIKSFYLNIHSHERFSVFEEKYNFNFTF